MNKIQAFLRKIVFRILGIKVNHVEYQGTPLGGLLEHVTFSIKLV